MCKWRESNIWWPNSRPLHSSHWYKEIMNCMLRHLKGRLFWVIWKLTDYFKLWQVADDLTVTTRDLYFVTSFCWISMPRILRYETFPLEIRQTCLHPPQIDHTLLLNFTSRSSSNFNPFVTSLPNSLLLTTDEEVNQMHGLQEGE